MAYYNTGQGSDGQDPNRNPMPHGLGGMNLGNGNVPGQNDDLVQSPPANLFSRTFVNPAMYRSGSSQQMQQASMSIPRQQRQQQQLQPVHPSSRQQLQPVHPSSRTIQPIRLTRPSPQSQRMPQQPRYQPQAYPVQPAAPKQVTITLETLKQWVKVAHSVLRNHPEYDYLKKLTPGVLSKFTAEEQRKKLMAMLVKKFGKEQFKAVYERVKKRSMNLYKMFVESAQKYATSEEKLKIKRYLTTANQRYSLDNDGQTMPVADRFQTIVVAIQQINPQLFAKCRDAIKQRQIQVAAAAQSQQMAFRAPIGNVEPLPFNPTSLQPLPYSPQNATPMLNTHNFQNQNQAASVNMNLQGQAQGVGRGRGRGRGKAPPADYVAGQRAAQPPVLSARQPSGIGSVEEEIPHTQPSTGTGGRGRGKKIPTKGKGKTTKGGAKRKRTKSTEDEQTTSKKKKPEISASKVFAAKKKAAEEAAKKKAEEAAKKRQEEKKKKEEEKKKKKELLQKKKEERLKKKELKDKEKKEKEEKEKERKEKEKELREKQRKEQAAAKKKALELAEQKRRKARLAKIAARKKAEEARLNRPVSYEKDFLGGTIMKKRNWDPRSMNNDENIIKRHKIDLISGRNQKEGVLPIEVLLGVAEYATNAFVQDKKVLSKKNNASDAKSISSEANKNGSSSTSAGPNQSTAGLNSNSSNITSAMPPHKSDHKSSDQVTNELRGNKDGLPTIQQVASSSSTTNSNSVAAVISVGNKGAPNLTNNASLPMNGGSHKAIVANPPAKKPDMSLPSQTKEKVEFAESMTGYLNLILRETMASLVKLCHHREKCSTIDKERINILETIRPNLDVEARVNAMRTKLYHTNKELDLLEQAKAGLVKRGGKNHSHALRLLKKDKANPGSLKAEKKKAVDAFISRSKTFYGKQDAGQSSKAFQVNKDDVLTYLKTNNDSSRRIWLTILNDL